MSFLSKLEFASDEQRLQYQFRLVVPDKGIVKGVMTNDVSLSGGNTFTTTGALTRELPILGRFQGGLDSLTGAARKLGGHGFYSKGETAAKWEESQKPSFTIEFTLYASTAKAAVENTEQIKLIKSCVLPINAGGSLLAPLGYGSGVSTKGTLTLSIGNWLVARKLVMVNETCTPSKQVMSNSYPLFWTCNFTVEPYGVVTEDEFIAYFQPIKEISSISGAGKVNEVAKETDIEAKLRNGIEKFKSIFG